MNQKGLRRIEILLILLLVILAIVVVGGISLYVYLDKHGIKQAVEEVPESTGLADATTFLPDNCYLYSEMPDVSFTDVNGEKVSVSDYQGKTLIITFWASWCPDCHEQFAIMEECTKIVSAKEDVVYLLVDKLDNDKETKEQALQYLNDNQITLNTYFDDGLSVYDELGMHNVPTTFFIDKEGILRAWSGTQITKTSVFEALLNNCMEGSEKITEGFVLTQMTDTTGGIHSSFDPGSQDMTMNSDVLSESQGAFLEYAIQTENKELFNQTLQYVKDHMWKNGMVSWRVTAGKPDKVNALIDDLRIYESLVQANEVWGGYDEQIGAYEENILQYGINEEKYIDFYDFEYKEAAGRFTLCYGDLKAMKLLASENETYKNAYKNAHAIVTDGMISDEFPLYYSWYNYETGQYESSDLNMSEAMVTLLHLAEVKELPNETVKWLKKELYGDGIRARYDVHGNVVSGYGFESTATYALVAMIGQELGDEEITGKALKKMEKMRINDAEYGYNGAFGNENGTGITSFDQVMPMLAYTYCNAK